ncbi:MAG: hypothetical protein EXS51_01835 [Candidatus Taylorbacteria bacterium]|nr:hypothetical protein [Candidatus Taylorbacteria bacterium]
MKSYSHKIVFGLATALLFTATVVSAQTAGVFAQPAPIRTGEKKEMNAVPDEALKARQETRSEVKVIRQEAVTGAKEARQEVRKEVKTVREEARTDAKNIREEAREGVKAIRADESKTSEEVREATKGVREEARKALEAKREATKQAAEAKREEFKKAVETRKEAVKTEIEKKRMALKEKLATVKDEKKKLTVEKVDTQLEAINARQTENFTNLLGKIEDALQNISSRADKAEAKGLLVTDVRTAITSAQTAITTAREAVAIQSAKAYVITVTTETALKTAVETARKSLRTDLTATQTAVKNAHEVVRAAATTLAKIPNVDTAGDEEGDAPASSADATTNQ